jgi:chromosome segregation ATPase
MELKKLKKLVAQYERDLESQRTSSNSNHDRERELEEKLEEREREIRELRRLKADRGDEHGVVRELEIRNSELEGEVEGVRELLQDNMEEIERLRDLLERRDDDLSESSPSGTSRAHLMHRISDLEEELSELQHQLQVQTEAIAQRDDDKDELIDVIESLKLELEDLHRRREAESVERSESRAMIMEEREEREAVEDDLNAMKDRVAALLIEIQQKEDEIDQKNREIDELVAEHKRIVEVVEDEWRGEVEEARVQADELKDVSSF